MKYEIKRNGESYVTELQIGKRTLTLSYGSYSFEAFHNGGRGSRKSALELAESEVMRHIRK